jgi:gliding motility-associated lipoprotein GldH
MKKRITKWVASSLTLLAMTTILACCGSKGFDQRVVIPEAKWDVENRVPIDVTVNDTLGIYAFGLGLRHMENYRYSNLFVFLHTTMPNGNVTHDTIQCILATPEGRWVGKSSGSMRDVRLTLNPNLRFPLEGTYHFEIEQAMREPVLKGISDIGLFIEKQP